jgi:hypothetical protein
MRMAVRSLASALALVMASATSFADMGRAPVGSNGTYVSLEGGYLLQSSDGVLGYGTATGPGSVTDITVSPDSGWFAGGMIGFVNNGPLIAGLPFTRTELYGFYGRANDSRSGTAPPFSGISLKNDDASLLVDGGVSGSTSIERQTAEGGVRFEGDSQVNATTSLTWVLAPFVRWNGEDTNTVVVGCCNLLKDASVDTWMYGVVLAMEPEVALTSQVSFVGRLGAGIYGWSAGGAYHSYSTLPKPDPFAAALSDSDSGVGFRGQLGAGLKFKLGPAMNLETFAEADYFSDTGTARLSNAQPGDITQSHTGSTDLWDLRAGARVTIGLGGP